MGVGVGAGSHLNVEKNILMYKSALTWSSMIKFQRKSRKAKVLLPIYRWLARSTGAADGPLPQLRVYEGLTNMTNEKNEGPSSMRMLLNRQISGVI